MTFVTFWSTKYRAYYCEQIQFSVLFALQFVGLLQNCQPRSAMYIILSSLVFVSVKLFENMKASTTVLTYTVELMPLKIVEIGTY